MRKKFLAGILAVFLLTVLMPTGYAASSEALEAANSLHSLGLFNGTGTDGQGNPIYDLDRTPTRHEAVTMLVRLLGREDEAKSGSWSTPFTDVAAWAKPYVGYAYANDLANGTTQTTFSGEQNVTATQYLTFVLRALNYQSGTDFQWDKAWELSDRIGLTNGQYRQSTTNFTRGDAAIISNRALNICQKNSNSTLYSAIFREETESTNYDIEIQWDEDNDYIMVGESKQLTAKTVPSQINEPSITWTSAGGVQGSEYYTVTPTGVITGIKPGLDLIYAETATGVCKIGFIRIKGTSPIMLKNMSYNMNSVGGTIFTFDITNNGSKAIKYIMLEWKCLNAVDDPIPDTISFSNVFSTRITGPLNPGQTMSNLHNTRPFYNYTFAGNIEVVDFVVTYMDDSIEIIEPKNYIDYWDIAR